jgi:acyl-CoA thioesterase FadM
MARATMTEANTATELVVGTSPVTVRRRVKWGECDPAGVVYMVNYGEYVVSAYELFMAVLLAETFQNGKTRHRMALPAKAFSIEFQASLRPDDEFLMTVAITDVRTKTFDVAVCGRSIDHQDRFLAKLTPIAVDPFERTATPLPLEVTRRLQHYRESGSLRGGWTKDI